MGREVRRVPVKFSWPINKIWDGFINPYWDAIVNCPSCEGTGMSLVARRLSDDWYGRGTFKPEQTGSRPFQWDDAVILAWAKGGISSESMQFWGITDPKDERQVRDAIIATAIYYADLFNSRWSCHLDNDDILAMWEAGELTDFKTIPSMQEMSLWRLSRLDDVGHWTCVKAKAKRLGADAACEVCAGKGYSWASEELKQKYESWKSTPPPTGRGYQMWETVSSGSPQTPVFTTKLGLITYLVQEMGYSIEAAQNFVYGSGWVPSSVISDGVAYNDIESAKVTS